MTTLSAASVLSFGGYQDQIGKARQQAAKFARLPRNTEGLVSGEEQGLGFREFAKLFGDLAAAAQTSLEMVDMHVEAVADAVRDATITAIQDILIAEDKLSGVMERIVQSCLKPRGYHDEDKLAKLMKHLVKVSSMASYGEFLGVVSAEDRTTFCAAGSKSAKILSAAQIAVFTLTHPVFWPRLPGILMYALPGTGKTLSAFLACMRLLSYEYTQSKRTLDWLFEHIAFIQDDANWRTSTEHTLTTVQYHGWGDESDVQAWATKMLGAKFANLPGASVDQAALAQLVRESAQRQMEARDVAARPVPPYFGSREEGERFRAERLAALAQSFEPAFGRLPTRVASDTWWTQPRLAVFFMPEHVLPQTVNEFREYASQFGILSDERTAESLRGDFAMDKFQPEFTALAARPEGTPAVTVSTTQLHSSNRQPSGDVPVMGTDKVRPEPWFPSMPRDDPSTGLGQFADFASAMDDQAWAVSDQQSNWFLQHSERSKAHNANDTRPLHKFSAIRLRIPLSGGGLTADALAATSSGAASPIGGFVRQFGGEPDTSRAALRMDQLGFAEVRIVLLGMEPFLGKDYAMEMPDASETELQDDAEARSRRFHPPQMTGILRGCCDLVLVDEAHTPLEVHPNSPSNWRYEFAGEFMSALTAFSQGIDIQPHSSLSMGSPVLSLAAGMFQPGLQADRLETQPSKVLPLFGALLQPSTAASHLHLLSTAIALFRGPGASWHDRALFAALGPALARRVARMEATGTAVQAAKGEGNESGFGPFGYNGFLPAYPVLLDCLENVAEQGPDSRLIVFALLRVLSKAIPKLPPLADGLLKDVNGNGAVWRDREPEDRGTTDPTTGPVLVPVPVARVETIGKAAGIRVSLRVRHKFTRDETAAAFADASAIYPPGVLKKIQEQIFALRSPIVAKQQGFFGDGDEGARAGTIEQLPLFGRTVAPGVDAFMLSPEPDANRDTQSLAFRLPGAARFVNHSERNRKRFRSVEFRTGRQLLLLTGTPGSDFWSMALLLGLVTGHEALQDAGISSFDQRSFVPSFRWLRNSNDDRPTAEDLVIKAPEDLRQNAATGELIERGTPGVFRPAAFLNKVHPDPARAFEILCNSGSLLYARGFPGTTPYLAEYFASDHMNWMWDYTLNRFVPLRLAAPPQTLAQLWTPAGIRKPDGMREATRIDLTKEPYRHDGRYYVCRVPETFHPTALTEGGAQLLTTASTYTGVMPLVQRIVKHRRVIFDPFRPYYSHATPTSLAKTVIDELYKDAPSSLGGTNLLDDLPVVGEGFRGEEKETLSWALAAQMARPSAQEFFTHLRAVNSTRLANGQEPLLPDLAKLTFKEFLTDYVDLAVDLAEPNWATVRQPEDTVLPGASFVQQRVEALKLACRTIAAVATPTDFAAARPAFDAAVAFFESDQVRRLGIVPRIVALYKAGIYRSNKVPLILFKTAVLYLGAMQNFGAFVTMGQHKGIAYVSPKWTAAKMRDKLVQAMATKATVQSVQEAGAGEGWADEPLTVLARPFPDQRAKVDAIGLMTGWKSEVPADVLLLNGHKATGLNAKGCVILATVSLSGVPQVDAGTVIVEQSLFRGVLRTCGNYAYATDLPGKLIHIGSGAPNEQWVVPSERFQAARDKLSRGNVARCMPDDITNTGTEIAVCGDEVECQVLADLELQTLRADAWRAVRAANDALAKKTAPAGRVHDEVTLLREALLRARLFDEAMARAHKTHAAILAQSQRDDKFAPTAELTQAVQELEKLLVPPQTTTTSSSSTPMSPSPPSPVFRVTNVGAAAGGWGEKWIPTDDDSRFVQHSIAGVVTEKEEEQARSAFTAKFDAILKGLQLV